MSHCFLRGRELKETIFVQEELVWECVGLATNGRGYQKSLFVSLLLFHWFPLAQPDLYLKQRGRPWPGSVFPLAVHEARKRMYFSPCYSIFLLLLIFCPLLKKKRVRLCMGEPILVPSFIRVCLLRHPRSDLLRLGICLLPTNYQPQPFRMPDQHLW